MTPEQIDHAELVQREARPPHQAGDGGASPTARLHRKEWRVETIARWEIQLMCELWHYSRSAPNTATYRHGLVHRESWYEHLGGCLWIPPTKGAAIAVSDEDSWRGVLACSRLVVAPGVPKNAASFLLAHSMRLIDRDRWPVLVTYADTAQGHTGAIYRATGWACDGPVPAGDTWVGPNGEQRGRKRGGRTLAAAEMRAAGFTRSRRAPKIRYRHERVAS